MTARSGTWLDHFVVGIDELEKGIASFATRSGVTLEFGGEHPTLGTHNALASLGEPHYLEVLAPRPGSELSPMFAEAADHGSLTPILWACATDDIRTLHANLVAAGFAAPPPSPGSRVTTEGDTLRWSMFMLGEGSPANAPFFIEWEPGTRHPSTTTPSGCTLQSYCVGSRDIEELTRLLEVAGMEVPHFTSEPGTTIKIATPRGSVTLGG